MKREEIDGTIALTVERAKRYLEALDDAPAHSPSYEEAAWRLDGGLPDKGAGAEATLRRLWDEGLAAAVASSGPRNFHFVTGGVTPAALGADWFASTIDQTAFAWVSSPLATQLERLSVAWLQELFDLPESWGGVLTTGATAANFVALGAARRWWGERHGVDVDSEGLAGLPPVPMIASGYVHTTAVKAIGMLGLGRSRIQVLGRDEVGRFDLAAAERVLEGLDRAPALILATAGDVNDGGFDPLAELADLAERYEAWLHVDGAFGLFARVSPRSGGLADGIERAHSVIADGHKWLNVPYDCGFAFVHDAALLPPVFNAAAAYLPAADPKRPMFGFLGPESSRRARSLAVWATLHAYGRAGYRELVERNLDLAQHLARRVDDEPELERLAEVPLNIVCFRYRPKDAAEDALDDLNARLGGAVLEDGRVYVGTTRYGGRVAFRPAIVNWRTREEDVELLVDVILELGAKLR